MSHSITLPVPVLAIAGASHSQCSTRLHACEEHRRGKYMTLELTRLPVGKCTGLEHKGWRQIRGTPRVCVVLPRNGCESAGEKLLNKFRVQCQAGGGSNVIVEDWTKKLPAKRKALYSHSLPCIEAWLQSLGFVQCKEDRAVWNIERSDWHAQLSLDVTDLYIRYLKKGPGNLERDIERKFSYALSREDLENAILGGP